MAIPFCEMSFISCLMGRASFNVSAVSQTGMAQRKYTFLWKRHIFSKMRNE